MEIDKKCALKEESNLKKLFNIYYDYINSDVGLLAKNSNEIIFTLQKLNNKITLNENEKIDLSYYMAENKQIKNTYKGKRYAKQHFVLTDQINQSKIRTSVRANYIHVLDAAVVRYVISIKPILTVHDCFLIDYRSTTFLIAIINDAMRKTFHDLKLNQTLEIDKIFSIFIVI